MMELVTEYEYYNPAPKQNWYSTSEGTLAGTYLLREDLLMFQFIYCILHFILLIPLFPIYLTLQGLIITWPRENSKILSRE
jgi:hypothetical protein